MDAESAFSFARYVMPFLSLCIIWGMYDSLSTRIIWLAIFAAIFFFLPSLASMAAGAIVLICLIFMSHQKKVAEEKAHQEKVMSTALDAQRKNLRD